MTWKNFRHCIPPCPSTMTADGDLAGHKGFATDLTIAEDPVSGGDTTTKLDRKGSIRPPKPLAARYPVLEMAPR
jgi:hypothetical protein